MITISKRIFWNAFVKEIMPVPSKVLDRIILNFLLLACLQVLDVLLVLNTNLQFPIVILPAISTYFKSIIKILPISRPIDYI